MTARAELEGPTGRHLDLKLHPNDLFIVANNKPVIDHGEVEVMIGGLKDKFELKQLQARRVGI
jgi:hypothetical protein